MIGLLVPESDTPEYITVIRFTQDGMPVNWMLVPEVDACAVSEATLELRPGTATVPVPAGMVSVPFVAVVSSCRVTLPPPEELSFRLMVYSYMMFMEPASKVLVPTTVVTLKAVRAAPSVTDPAESRVLAESLKASTALSTQVFPLILIITMFPCTTLAAATELLTINPDEKFEIVAPELVEQEPKYPLVV